MSQPDAGDKLTLIVVPDETARVRRLQVPKRWLRQGAWLGGVVLLFAGVAFVDWVRLRIAAVDVAAMREQTAADARELVSLADRLHGLEQQLEQLREFERKVRLIAHLPSALPEVETSAAVGGDAEPQGGEGGPEDAADAEPADPASADATQPAGAAPHVRAAPRRAGPGLDEAALVRIARKADRLRGTASQRGLSFEELIGQLDGKSRQLASTPSIAPSDGWVTSSYGYRISPFTGKRQFHSGLDIAADFGTPIVAPATGRVSFVGRKGPLGKTVVVDHGYGLQTTYGHAAEIFVRRGEEVDRGQRLASVGSTGRSTGPHLHYAVKVRGKLVDPADYILD